MPAGRDVTYATFVLDYRPLKTEPHRVRILVGEDKLTYASYAGSPAANLLETKIILNSIISDASKGACFMSADLKDFFLATPMEGDEYMRVKYKHIPEDIRIRYNLKTKVTKDNYVFIRIEKGMYGLKQAALLAYNHLKENLAQDGYSPIIGTVGLWKHETRSTNFCVCVDDFGIKYFTTDDAHHLLNSLGKHYKYTTDRKGKNYCGLTMDRNFTDGYMDISIPEYVPNSLKPLCHTPEKSPQFYPHEHAPIQYGQKGAHQFSTALDKSPQLTTAETKHTQSTTCSFLYYGRAIDYSILPALNDIASAQAQPTIKTKKRLRDSCTMYTHTQMPTFVSTPATRFSTLTVTQLTWYIPNPGAESPATFTSWTIPTSQSIRK